MSRLEKFEPSAQVSEEFTKDPDIQLWLKMGRIASVFCLWMAMLLPILLIWSVRF